MFAVSPKKDTSEQLLRISDRGRVAGLIGPQCDFQHPICGACDKAGAQCLGFDSVSGTDKPRNTIRHLEEEVARLETDLKLLRDRTTDTRDIANASVEKLTARLATAMVDPECLGKQENLPLTSPFFISGSPTPYLNSSALDGGEENQLPEQLPSPISVANMPSSVVHAMLKHYCDLYRPMYPAIDESELFSARDRVYSGVELSPYDVFCVHITLAISTNTLMHQDEKRATAATRGLWAAARSQLDHIGSDPWERLQALQLLTHYACLNPQDVHCVNCGAAATRLAVQLGLHQELPPLQSANLDVVTLNSRRRMFWNAYCLEVAIHTTICRPLLWQNDAITARFPDFDSASWSTPHVWRLRHIEAEITHALYYPDVVRQDLEWSHSFDRWFVGVQQRLDEWYRTTRQSIGLSEKIEFHEVMFLCLTIRLNRPSPGYPQPTPEMRKRMLHASTALIREYSKINRMGKLFMIWHAAYFILESGVCILAFVLTALESTETGELSSHLEGEDASVLVKCIRTCPCLLEKISRRWPALKQHVCALEGLSHSVLAIFERRSTGAPLDLCSVGALKDKLSLFSLFSPLPTRPRSAASETVSTQHAELPRAPHDGTMITDWANQAHLTAAQSAPAVDPPAETDGFEEQWAFTHSTPSLSNYYNFELGDDLQFDFDGLDSHEIFAAFLDTDDTFMQNDITDSTFIPLDLEFSPEEPNSMRRT